MREGNGFRRDYLRAVWGSGANDVWVGGDLGALSHWDGVQFKPQPQ